MKRILTMLLAVLLCVFMAACNSEPGEAWVPTEPDETEAPAADFGELVILFTGGLEGAYARHDAQGTVGYGALAAYVDALEEDATVILIDGGHSVAPGCVDELWQIVDACGYDLRVPGELELSNGVRKLVNRAEDLKDCTYISCNLMDLTRNTTVFEPYVIVDVDSVQVGFVGVTRPQALSEDDYGLLGTGAGQELYDVVQQAIDDAADAGAEYVVVVGNLGTDPADSPWTTAEVIANITGMAAWLDCGSGAVLDGDTVADKDDFEIPVCAPGYGFRYVGQVILDLNDGSASADLLTEFDEEDRSIRNMIQDLDDAK